MHLSVDGEPLGELGRVQLEPGDVLVLSFSGRVNSVQARMYRDRLQEHFPGHDVVIISDGATLDIVKPAGDGHVGTD